jgi:predicted O-linked N-acetylglucosamine transferase (SPINDLY family)
MSDAAAARAIYSSGIDILIDGQGYNRGARPGILARRPAPVQAAYLVYAGTTGADFLDYLIADRFVVPPEAAGAYSEPLKYLPHSYQCTDDRRAVADPPTRAQCRLPDEGLVLCCFNQTYKITPGIFDIWCRILHATPGSVLWLWASASGAPDNLRREARARGVDEGRLVFAESVPQDRHLARMALADLFLDTLPYNAHTTTSDALWAGVPVVTCAGETFASRVAGSLLHAAGLPDLVTSSLTEYEALALGLARDREALTALRKRVAASRGSPLFDTARITRDLEAIYEEMWQEFLTGPA